MGKAIGRPDLQWVTFSDEETLTGLQQAGVPLSVAEKLVELGSSIHSAALREDYDLHTPVKMGNIKMADFAKEFAEVFNDK
ncbi:hypothetical protein [Desertivirga xinjiangensis]|uniref:hypothetical protein n=1 Tax=Desertivirga xinjiangensis TaxID=539206 RepID=UPI00210D50E5|nr:hypothetical protein [Pedobacter xinjiangensis]